MMLLFSYMFFSLFARLQLRQAKRKGTKQRGGDALRRGSNLDGFRILKTKALFYQGKF